MDLLLGIVLGITNCALMMGFFLLGVYKQRKWQRPETYRQARRMMDDLIFDAHKQDLKHK